MNDPATITKEQASALPTEGGGMGIYFLWRDAELLYIGASTRVMDRIYRQKMFARFGQWGSETSQKKPRIPFNRATILAMTDLGEMAEIEKQLIERFDPPWNVRRGKGGDEVWGRMHERRDEVKTSGSPS